ncbi:helix-turn-helix domain-containing protein [Amycolatopsis albispora]|uniref:helix-turn-helix domain-containing protein n=1 Tax=Amycolatopsis albispora TaxID=1804986 RepID=UPI0013B3787E|nr:helix-turn-helix transcriptional regulator [Amycolatopsis albispora]
MNRAEWRGVQTTHDQAFLELLGGRLRAVRMSRGAACTDVGKAVHRLSGTSVSMIERGQQRITVSGLRDLCRFLNLDMPSLLGGVEADLGACRGPYVWVPVPVLDVLAGADGQYAPLREWVLAKRGPRAVGEFDREAFQRAARACGVPTYTLRARLSAQSSQVFATSGAWAGPPAAQPPDSRER